MSTSTFKHQTYAQIRPQFRPHFSYLFDFVTRAEIFQIGDRKKIIKAIKVVIFWYVDKPQLFYKKNTFIIETQISFYKFITFSLANNDNVNFASLDL